MNTRVKLLPHIKRRLARPRASVYRVYRSAISSGKRTWENHIKRWGAFILSGEWLWRNDFKLLRVTLAVLAFILSVAILWRVFDWPEANWIDDRLGTATKLETIKILAQALFGLVIIFGLYVAYLRARASDKTAKTQQDANEQQRFNEAIAKLEDQSASVRQGGIYALDVLARLNKKNHLVSIVDILCTRLQKTTQQKNYQKKYKDKPSDEIQLLLRILTGLNKFSEEKQRDRQSNPVRLVLSDAYLVGADLRNACLNRANLSRTNMRKARLSRAQLQGAILKNAQMQRAYLMRAQLQRARLERAQLQMARLWGAQMQRAFLLKAQMQGAFLLRAQMQRAFLLKAQMQGATLAMAQMQGANLEGVQLQGASLWGAQMHGAYLQGAQMLGANVDQMQVQGAELQEVDLRGAYCQDIFEYLPLLLDPRKQIRERQGKPTDLKKTVTFKGGLKQEDVQRIGNQLTECQKDGWMTKKEVEKIKAILKEHQDKPPSRKLPKDSGAITGSYTKKEADAIIAVYKKAMAGVKNLLTE